MLRTCSILAVLLGVTCWPRPSFADGRGLEFFEARIRPVLVERCNRCHSAGEKAPEGGLRLDSPAGLVQGGDSGAVIAPGKVEESLRIARFWLDVARYAEDSPTGEATNKAPRNPHAYRDRVVRALNDDLPYDQFVRRQLAADLMPELSRPCGCRNRPGLLDRKITVLME